MSGKLMNRHTDPWLIAVVALLLTGGVVMVYSASAMVAGEGTGDELYYFKRQIIAIALGVVVCAATALTPTRLMRRYRVAFLTATIVGLLLCYVPGIQHSAGGAARWLGFGSLHVQPSEFAKITVLAVLADYLDRHRGQMSDWRISVRGFAMVVPVMALVLFEPDFGTTAIIAGMAGLMVFIAGARWLHMAIAGGAGLIALVAAMVAEPYRIARLLSFLDPTAAASGEGYQVVQSWVAMHSGGMWGQGLGNSLAKLHFLPEPWTDFIGSVIAEELGLAGLLVFMSLYSVLVWRGLNIALRARDPWSQYMAACITTMLGLQAAFNLGVMMGAVPPKGLVLPFVSYGASAVMAHLWCVGILLSIAAEADTTPVAAGWGADPERQPRQSVIIAHSAGAK